MFCFYIWISYYFRFFLIIIAQRLVYNFVRDCGFQTYQVTTQIKCERKRSKTYEPLMNYTLCYRLYFYLILINLSVKFPILCEINANNILPLFIVIQPHSKPLIIVIMNG